ncbi:unnamed protein product [Caenorhabditis auriculariae]|uniref:Multidrug resistance-associated protein lethal(2)03659 n=1 Tax=Caenorhabditis auriculariae TaxID=2777116 RepID=A0A8S1GVL7_9PELO|nr:unnamed protein product [Caenorhabditis auriculariae]
MAVDESEKDHLNSIEKEKKLKNGKLELSTITYGDEDDGMKPNLEAKATLPSRLLFCFIVPFFMRAMKGPLEEKDLNRPLPSLQSKTAFQKLNRKWSDYKYMKFDNIFFRAITHTFGKKVAAFGILLFIEELIHIAQPLFMGRLMSYFRTGSTLTEQDAYIAAAGIAVTSLISPLIHHPYFYGLLKIGTECRIATCTMLFNKGLTLSTSALQKTTVGQIINLLSTDVNKLDTAFMFVHYIWLSPLLVFFYGYALWMEIGVSSLAGFACLMVIMCVQYHFSKQMGLCRKEIAKRADKRIGIMNEILVGIRVIKMYTWEDAFSKIVANLRGFEMKKVRDNAIAQSMVMGLFYASGKLIILCAVLCYVYLGNDLTAERVFVAFALYNSCRLPFSLFLPFGLQLLFEMRVTARRVQDFLLLEEFSQQNATAITPGKDLDSSFSSDIKETLLSVSEKSTDAVCEINKSKNSFNAEVVLQSFTTTWSADETSADATAIKGASLSARCGDLVAVIGQVGAGKSSLLSSILGEARPVSGSLKVSGRVAYCSQEAWIFAGTIRENILFGREYEENKYREIVSLCVLLPDFQQFPNGDKAQVGDRGSTLSGGQRARVSLARALYSDADIYLLDDPLSAVDASVGRLIFEKCISEYLKKKIVILVTHQIQFLENLDKVSLMENGEVVETGKLADLREKHSHLFAEMIKEEIAVATAGDQLVNRVPSYSRRISHDRRVSDSSHTECSTPHEIDSPKGESSFHLPTKDVEEVEEPEKQEESRSQGSVPLSVYFTYVKSMFTHGFMAIPLLIFVLLVQVLFNVVDWWLNRWTTAYENYVVQKNSSFENASVTKPDQYKEKYTVFGNVIEISLDDYKNSFIVLTLIMVACAVLRCMWFRMTQITASRNLHKWMFDAVVNTHMSFFDNNPIGRILNRFSKDVGTMDDSLSFVFFEFFMGTLNFLGVIFVICALNPFVLLSTSPLLIIFFLIRSVYVSTSRELKRLEATTRSPLYSHISATMNGLMTVRAFGRQDEMQRLFNQAQDKNTAAFGLTLVTARWFALYIDVLVSAFIAGVAFISVHRYGVLSSGEVALMLVYAVQLTGFFSWIMRQSAELQNGMVSVERIADYADLPSEHASDRKSMFEEKEKALGTSWPSGGRIQFNNVNVFYESEQVLKNVSFDIPSKHKVGIAGRTGAGKSTLLRVLFGLKPADNGTIVIDGIDVRDISLKYRRQNMAIIPQEPVLFIGTLRRNLDPFDEYSDDVLWDALEQVELKEVVKDLSGGLLASMQEGGVNFSVGQRQLVCLARALIHHAKILVIDEATANVDARTDSLIQQTIRTQFAECTVLTIAHRLNTIMECDEVMVFEKGEMIEFDSPKVLMENSDSALWQLAKKTGRENALLLRKLAQELHSGEKKT